MPYAVGILLALNAPFSRADFYPDYQELCFAKIVNFKVIQIYYEAYIAFFPPQSQSFFFLLLPCRML